jgi:hypothetical protein
MISNSGVAYLMHTMQLMAPIILSLNLLFIFRKIIIISNKKDIPFLCK